MRRCVKYLWIFIFVKEKKNMENCVVMSEIMSCRIVFMVESYSFVLFFYNMNSEFLVVMGEDVIMK